MVGRATVIQYTLLAMGTLTKLTKEIWDDNISQAEDGDQIYAILTAIKNGLEVEIVIVPTVAKAPVIPVSSYLAK